MEEPTKPTHPITEKQKKKLTKEFNKEPNRICAEDREVLKRLSSESTSQCIEDILDYFYETYKHHSMGRYFHFNKRPKYALIKL